MAQNARWRNYWSAWLAIIIAKFTYILSALTIWSWMTRMFP